MSCYYKPSTNEFIFNYKTNSSIQNQPDITRVEPTIQRIRNFLEIIRSKEDKYQSLLENFDVFNMLNPDKSLKPLALFNDYCDEKINCALSNMICKENKCKCITTNKQVYFWTGKRCVECIYGWHSFYGKNKSISIIQCFFNNSIFI
ncbi:unnamed protein product [Rotaria sp. Silwood1]|nr:unnamed protein product [Rotaria sp. Silwood1]